MSDEAACGHTKIREVRWNTEGATSGKFMCLDCNTDFVPLTPAIRRFLFQQEFEREQALKPLEVPPGLTTSTSRTPSATGQGQRGSEAGCYG